VRALKSSEQAFWEWFEARQDELIDFESDRERIFDEFGEQLSRVHPGLCFEFGPRDAQREFVISAGGLRDVFPAGSSLVAAAPALQRWRITAFRPRRTPLNSVQLGDVRVEPDDVEFSLLTNGTAIGLRLFLPGFTEGNVTLKQIGYLMLDEALGEYDVETKVGLIQMLPPESPRTGTRHLLAELPSRFDQLALSLAGPSSIH
jgi:hypothetical protein